MELCGRVQCAYCTKTFLSDEFLRSHMVRRHPDKPLPQSMQNGAPPSVQFTAAPASAMLVTHEKELLELRNQLRALEDERRAKVRVQVPSGAGPPPPPAANGASVSATSPHSGHSLPLAPATPLRSAHLRTLCVSCVCARASGSRSRSDADAIVEQYAIRWASPLKYSSCLLCSDCFVLTLSFRALQLIET